MPAAAYKGMAQFVNLGDAVIMKQCQTALLFSLLALSACTPDLYRVDVGAMFVQGDGAIALQNGSGSLVLHDNQHDLSDNLGLGDTEAAPYLRFEFERELHRVRAHGFGFGSSGSGTLASNFGDIPSGSLVDSSMDFFGISATYAYEVLGDENYRVGVGGMLGYYGLDIEARTGALFESVDTDLLVPMPYAEAEYDFGQVVVGANLGFMGADIRDANGRWVDFEAMIRWEPTGKMELLAGYRMIILDAYGQATQRDFDSDLEFEGFVLGGGVRF